MSRCWGIVKEQITHLQVSKPILTHHIQTRLHSPLKLILVRSLIRAESTHEAETSRSITQNMPTCCIHYGTHQDIQANRGVTTPAIQSLSSRNTNIMHSNMGLPVTILTCPTMVSFTHSLTCILNDKVKADTQCGGALTMTPGSLCDGVSSQSLKGWNGSEKECRKTLL